MSWSKSEEISMLRKFAAKLGDRSMSYTGEWLTAELPNLERAINDDFPASVYANTYREVEAIRNQIVNDARASADRVIEKARMHEEATQRRCAELLKNAEERLLRLRDACRRADGLLENVRSALNV